MATTERPIRVKIRPVGQKAESYGFKVKSPSGQAARFVREKYHALLNGATKVNDHELRLTDGGSLVCTGATLSELGLAGGPLALPESPPAATSRPAKPLPQQPKAPKPPKILTRDQLKKLTLTDLTNLALARGLSVPDGSSRAEVINLLAAK